MSSKTIRTLSVLASAGLILGAFVAGPADAKKKKKPKPPAPTCPAYEPSEWSADVPVTVVKDEHTAEAPLTVTVPTHEGVGSSSPNPPEEDPTNPISRVFLNVQVDSSAATTGLYATVSHTPVFDYDLYIRGNDGVGLAYSAGFAQGVPLLDGTGHGGHTGIGTENVEGLTTDDCQGYLVDIISALTPGEDVELTLWLGEATYIPGS